MDKNKIIKNNIFFILLFITISNSLLLPQAISTKKGGLSFRVDDNGLISQYRDYADLFNKYGSKFNFAMNLSNNEFETVGYADSIRKFQDLGHLLMDHTPSHATNFFITKFDTTHYSGINAVNHIVGNKICLSHEEVDTNSAIFSGYADLDGHTILFSSTDYHSLTHYSELNKEGRYFYFPLLDTLLLVNSFHNSNKSGRAFDIWKEDINFSENSSIKYFTFNRDQVTITQEAFTLLVSETKKLCDSLYNLTPPTIWIQPGGHFPILNSLQVKAPLESLGFKGAATYPNDAEKVYNEYNPNNERGFAFQWGDFVEDEMSLEVVKAKIADGIAKHKVMINNIHWYSSVNGNQDWLDYLELMDNLLEWADTNGIPIDTYDNWIEKLYTDLPNPYENIIPPLNVDLDDNGIPDGYTNIGYPDPTLTGVLVNDNTAPDSIAYSSANIGKISLILTMGGIEKGENEFSVWTKGDIGNTLRVVFSGPWKPAPTNIFSTEFKFPANTTEWTKYDLSQSINGNTSLIIPDSLSLINIDFYHQSNSTKNLSFSGVELRKKIELDSLKFTLLNNNPIQAGDSIYVEVRLLNEFGNPVTSSYNFNLTFPDTSTTELLTTEPLWFNSTSVDTIVIKDTVSGISSFTGNLINAPIISGQLDVSVLPSTPNSITILSNSDSLIIGGQKLFQVALEDSFLNRIPDSLITFTALNGNGKFSNSLQLDSSTTNIFGIAEKLYTASTSLDIGFDSIVVSYANTLIDTIILPLETAPLNNIMLTKISQSPSYDNDTILVEISAKDIFNNFVINSEKYFISSLGSNSLKVLGSNDLSFNNNFVDTLSIADSLAGLFNLIVKLESDSLIADTLNFSVEYSEKNIAIKMNLESVYDSLNNLMNVDLNSFIPLVSPYIESLDTVTTVPDSIVDWVLVTLRRDLDPQIPNPITAIDFTSKSAFLTKFGNIIDPKTMQNLAFTIPEDWYYILVKHRNHMPIMSSSRVYLTK